MTDPIPPSPPSGRLVRLGPRDPAERQHHVRRRLATLLRFGLGDRQQLSFQLLGRVLLHSALVGGAAGVVGCLFVAGLELTQIVFLERVAGYLPLRAAGERLMSEQPVAPFRPWLLLIVPAVGSLIAGALSRFAPETRGGGSDAIIEAFHARDGVVRRRVPIIKVLASIFTLGFGGSGGREGPTMQIGGALGSIVGRYLGVPPRERRILLVAGTAAGMAAVFRTPLGAALLAVEVLHRDDFESDALVPAVLASVVSYSVFISFYGESTLFGNLPHQPFVPSHLPLFGLMAVIVSFIARGFLASLQGIQRLTRGLRVPEWTKPGLGGLALGVFATPVVMLIGPHVGQAGQGLGILGGGYGAAQVALTGAQWFPGGWYGLELLVVLGVVKIFATSCTVGTGGSAGDFGPSLVIGGIFGGAFGRLAQMVLHDPRIDPGAFALVGMGTFYGGLAHVPIASLVMVCELAGSYDLLVPLMLAEGIAFVALRDKSLYHAQVTTKKDSAAHREDLITDVLRGVMVGDVMIKDRDYVAFEPGTPAEEIVRTAAASEWQNAFPVFEPAGKIVGVINSRILRTLAMDRDLARLTVAADLMSAPAVLRETDDLHSALEQILAQEVRELVVTDAQGIVVGFLDEAEITRAYHGATSTLEASSWPARPGAS